MSDNKHPFLRKDHATCKTISVRMSLIEAYRLTISVAGDQFALMESCFEPEKSRHKRWIKKGAKINAQPGSCRVFTQEFMWSAIFGSEVQDEPP